MFMPGLRRSHTRIKHLLVSFDSEIRKSGCRAMTRISELGHSQRYDSSAVLNLKFLYEFATPHVGTSNSSHWFRCSGASLPAAQGPLRQRLQHNSGYAQTNSNSGRDAENRNPHAMSSSCLCRHCPVEPAGNAQPRHSVPERGGSTVIPLRSRFRTCAPALL